MPHSGTIAVASTPEQVRRCHVVAKQLRPHLDEDAFVAQVVRQQGEGYQLAFFDDGGEVRGVAGFRFFETLFAGPMMYVDDLVTDERQRSKGVGGALLDWLAARARERGCIELHLDSGVHRFDAHRFYFTKRMHISSYHFKMKLA
jgi:GNAT superfamily N-acetyltransferase